MAGVHLARQFLSDCLEGIVPTADSLKALASAFSRDESLWLEWKSAKLSSTKKKLNEEVREAVVAFANAEGGSLVLGFDENAKSFDNFSAPGGDAPKWADSAINPIALTPSPKIYAIDVDRNRVVVIAVPRSDSLVWCIEEGQPKYYLRTWTGNIEAPSYLQIDLLAGRRQRPNLVPFLQISDPQRLDTGQSNHTRIYRCTLELSITNDSLIFVEDLRASFVTYRSGVHVLGAVPHALRERIQIEDLPAFPPFKVQLGLGVWKLGFGTLEPFETRSATPSIQLDLPVLEDLKVKGGLMDLTTIPSVQHDGRLGIGAALCVFARGVPPLWFQVSIRTSFENGSPAVEVASASRIPTRPKAFVEFLAGS